MGIDTNDKNGREPTFEELYPRAEFAELIRLSLVLTDTIIDLWAWLKLHAKPPTTGDPSQA